MEIGVFLQSLFQWVKSLSWAEAGTILGVILGFIALLGHGVKAIQWGVNFCRWLRGLFAKTPSRKTQGSSEAPPIQSLSGNTKMSANNAILTMEQKVTFFGKEPKMNQPNQQTAVEIRRPLSPKEEVTLQQ